MEYLEISGIDGNLLDTGLHVSSHVEISSHDDNNNNFKTSTPVKLATPVKVNHCYQCTLCTFSTKTSSAIVRRGTNQIQVDSSVPKMAARLNPVHNWN